MASDVSGDYLDHVVLRRPIIRYVDDDRLPANPITKDIVDGPLDTQLIPRRRIGGKHVNIVSSDVVPIRGFRDDHWVLAIAPENAIVDVHDPRDHERGQPIEESWFPLVAHFAGGRLGAVVVPTKEVDL